MRTLKSFQFVFRFTWKNGKCYIASIFLFNIIECLGILAGIYIPKLIVDGLVNGKGIEELFPIILGFCIIMFIVGQIGVWSKSLIWIIQAKLQKKLISTVMWKAAKKDRNSYGCFEHAYISILNTYYNKYEMVNKYAFRIQMNPKVFKNFNVDLFWDSLC